MNSSHSDPAQTLVEHNFVFIKLFELVRNQRLGVRVGSLGLPSVLLAVAYHDTNQAIWWLALLPMLVMQIVREWVIRYPIPDADQSVAVTQWINRLLGMSVFSGLAQASTLLAFPFISDIGRGLYTLLLLSFSTASVSSNAGQPRIFLAFALPFTLPLAMLWMWVPGQHYSALTGWGVGMLVLMMLAIMLRSFTQTTWHLFDQTCRIRFRERQLNQRLRQALDDARQAAEAKTRFLAAASHDLRQPLHVISLVTAALRMRSLDAQSSEMVDLLGRVSASINGQLTSLLDISKLDAGLVQPCIRPVNIAQFLTNCFDAMAPLASAKGVEPILRLNTHGAVLTDPILLDRILVNLCQNAIKYTQQGVIELIVSDHNDQVVISVADTGCGIPLEQHAAVFQEFVQLSNPERDASQGLGLGLSIVQRIAKLLNIKLRLVSAPDQGTIISLYLPRVELSCPESVVPVVDQSAHGKSVHLGLNVMVVDDDIAVRQACNHLLKALGCTPLLAQDFDEAKKLAIQLQPDVLLVDMRLRGGISGIEVICMLRTMLGHVPALLVSGDTAPEQLSMAAQAGLRICTKPLTLEQLLAELVRIPAAHSSD